MLKNISLYLLIVCFGCKGVSQEKEDLTSQKTAEKKQFAITKTEDEWKNQLTDIQFYILRKAGTETPFSSPLLNIKEKGTYACAACGTALFKSEYKFDSGTGWPSFDREIPGNVAYDLDYDLGYKRIVEHCATCGGHLGHVFDDGPRNTTGKRHCINGAALQFVPTP
ncbi:peptide-methionine (R)-S-oxide reductase MsrB [Arenibacter sp. GZD96]|uniref:peptide-methionine (R)-S-oxide reductase MsrB n=1 Tax=Aurantibrevibacter litoralis TaxID=3106030 RepID=UPI002AFE4867|nr:peptide-methionine (R)-S-oxide reductase MsrB [Arenibacter sp. GZD-96]MEA1784945.1 peptide-methionine (R)-S-oxide reductase MsrB [Arenibacter sp. GZD-96]